VLVHLAVARLLERPGFRSPGRAARAGILVACLLLVLGAGATVSPSARVAAAWSDLSRTTSGQGSPGVISLGTNRADFWRVGLDEFARHPVGGIGVDNFQAAYLQHRRSDEQPRASHSFVVRALSETGLVGTALLASFVLGVALVLTRRARREAPTGVVAQAAAVALTGWLLHGTVEWLWEMPATGALAFAIAGIGVGTAGGETVSLRPRPVVRAGVAVAVACVGLLAGALWLSVRYEERGAGRWRSEPVAAAADLRRAARLDPLGTDALLLRGAIAARRGRWQETRLAFAESLSRDPSNWYAWLELGLAEARLGHDHVALAAARRAGVLNPRESVPSLLIRAIRRADLPSQAELERELAASPT
jgi:hypothetical protein